MLRSIQGVYRDGNVELAEVPGDVHEPTPVIVTLLEAATAGPSVRGMDPAHAAEMRARLATFAEDWDSPEMAIYDDDDALRDWLGHRDGRTVFLKQAGALREDESLDELLEAIYTQLKSIAVPAISAPRPAISELGAYREHLLLRQRR